MTEGRGVADVTEIVRSLLPGRNSGLAPLDRLPVGVFIVGSDGRQIYENPAAKEILGKPIGTGSSAEERASATHLYIAGTGQPYPPERLPSMRALRGESVRAMDVEVHRADRVVVLDVSSSPLKDDSDAIVGAVIAFSDITAAAAAAQAYRTLIERVPLGIYSARPDGTILLANPALRAMLRYSADEPLTDVNLERDHTGRTQRLVFKRILEERGEIRAFESTWRRHDGSVIQVSQNATAIRDESGSIVSYEGIVEDITERKRTQEELRENRERYRQLVENASDIIYRCDAYGHFTYVNPTVRKVLGYSEEELLGKEYTELITPEYRELVRSFYEVQFRTRTPNTYFEFPVKAKDGSVVWMGQNVQTVATGQWVLGFQAMARDISERKRMEVELAQARDAALASARVKSEFLANMSHEIRTPMNGVVGMADLLVRTALSPEQREYVHTIRASAESLLALVDDILDLSKIEAGKLTIKPVDFDLDDLMDAITDVFAERAAAKGLGFRMLIYPDVQRHLRGDVLRVRQVLMNLIGNALKFTERGEVTVSVMREQETDEATELWFLVNDTGPGIAEHDQQRLFEPFVQADASSTRKHGGTGLGLAISRQLVDLLGGRIGVASVPGEGSTFWFTVQMQRDLRPEVTARRPALQGIRALLVDSNEMNRLVLRRHLSSSSVTVEEVSSAEEALSALRSAAAAGQSFDVVVLEMQLGAMDGIQAARSIHADPIIRTTPIVLVTAIGRRKSDVEFFRAEGIDTFVMKPVRRAQLASAIAQVIRRLPVEVEEAPLQAAAQPPSPAGKRILIVEDNVVNQKVAIGQLRHLGYDSDVVGSGAEALEMIRRRQYDLVLLDCQMPDIDGYEVARALRRMESESRRIPIVAMTAHTNEGERERCIAAGMDDYLAKPVSTQRLSGALARWLGTREQIVDEEKIAGLQTLARENPTFLRDITALFREDAFLRLHELRDSAAAGNLEALARAAHSLKSSSGNIGATRMYSLCATIESEARRGKMTDLAAMVDQLATELDRALEVLTETSGNSEGSL